MLDDGLHSHHWRDCRIGGTVPVSGFFNTLLRGPLLPAGIGASGYHGCSPSTSTRDVGLDSRRHGGTGARSLLYRRSVVRTNINQDTSRTRLQIKTQYGKQSSLSQRHKHIERTPHLLLSVAKLKNQPEPVTWSFLDALSTLPSYERLWWNKFGRVHVTSSPVTRFPRCFSRSH